MNQVKQILHYPVKKFLRVFFLFYLCTPSFAQLKITGIISGTGGLPLSGVTVAIKETNVATVTDQRGYFSIAAHTGDMLTISYIGYKTRQIKITDKTSLKLSLSESLTILDEVLVTGYTSQKVKEITGSVAIVKPKDLISFPAGRVEQMLQGRVAGLNVITSGLPGGASNVRLHGIGNFGDVTPLYVIDGVQGNINNLNPNDIESLQVLKDAGAYSIYGVRGANGVIIITTRNGKPGKTKISYDFYMGTTRPLKTTIDLLNPQEMADVTWLAFKNLNQTPSSPLYGNGATPVLPDYFIAGINMGLSANDPLANPDLYNIDFTNGAIHQIVKSNKTGTDWFHELYKPASNQNHSLSVSGANEKNKYFFSLGYLDHQGTLLSTWLKRFTARINTEFSVGNSFRIGENLQWTYQDKGGIPDFGYPTDNDMFRAIITHPMLPVYDIKGGWAHLDSRAFFDNPVALRVIAKDDKSQSWETFGNIYAEVDVFKNFTARSSFGGNINNYYFSRFDFWTYYPRTDSLPDNALTESSGYHWSWTWTNTLKFSKKIQNSHFINALAGVEAINNYNREVGGRSAGFYTNDVNYRFLSNGIPTSVSWARSNYSFAGASSLYALISQIDYGFREKYFLRGTLRKDGASFFGARNRYGWFPSVSAAWRVTQEYFLNQLEWIDELKLRASWGKTGFYGNTDPFNQYTLYGGSIGDAYYDINGNNVPVQGFRTLQLGDPNTGWQEDAVTNIGFESVFWKGKLSATVDWYNKKARGLLFPVVLPDVLGGATPPNVNVGVVQNNGFDILLGSKGKWAADWQWDATTTISIYKNKILKLSNLAYFIPSFNTGGGFVRNQIGHPASSFYGYKIIGIFKDDIEVSNAAVQDAAGPGRFRYLDANNDKVINEDDRVFLGDANPDFTLGLNLGINYKNFDLSTFFYGSFGNEVINVPKTYTDFFVFNTAKSKTLLYDSWTPKNTGATIPIIEDSYNFSNIATVNSYALEDGSYFRNKSIILGYTFSKKILQKIKVEKLRIYVQAVNLFTITNYKGLDPELSGSSSAFGIDFGNYPNNEKRFLFGLNMSF